MSATESMYTKLSKDVEKNHDNIVSMLRLRGVLRENFKGTQILEGPLLDHPDVLILGVNPKSEQSGELVRGFSPLSELSCLKSDSVLSKDLVEVFEKADALDVLKNKTVKSNLYYTVTEETSNLWRTFPDLSGDGVESPEAKAKTWTKKMVSALRPKLIICEGSTALGEFSKFIVNQKTKMNASKVAKKQIAVYKVIAFSLKKDEGIANKESFVKLLKEAFEEIKEEEAARFEIKTTMENAVDLDEEEAEDEK